MKIMEPKSKSVETLEMGNDQHFISVTKQDFATNKRCCAENRFKIQVIT